MFLWLLLYIILSVALFGGMVVTMVSLTLGVWNRDRRKINFGLRFLLFTILASAAYFLLTLWLGNWFLDQVKITLDSF